MVDHLVAGVETELVQLSHEVVVAEVGTGSIHVVAAVVQSGLVVGVDGGTILAGNTGREAGVGSRHGRLSVGIGLIEVLDGGDALLRDVKVLLAGDCGEEGADGENRIYYLFHIQ